MGWFPRGILLCAQLRVCRHTLPPHASVHVYCFVINSLAVLGPPESRHRGRALSLSLQTQGRTAGAALTRDSCSSPKPPGLQSSGSLESAAALRGSFPSDQQMAASALESPQVGLATSHCRVGLPRQMAMRIRAPRKLMRWHCLHSAAHTSPSLLSAGVSSEPSLCPYCPCLLGGDSSREL